MQAGLTKWLCGWLAAAPGNAARRQALASWVALSSSSAELCRQGQTRLACVLADVAESLPQGMLAGPDGQLTGAFRGSMKCDGQRRWVTEGLDILVQRHVFDTAETCTLLAQSQPTAVSTHNNVIRHLLPDDFLTACQLVFSCMFEGRHW